MQFNFEKHMPGKVTGGPGKGLDARHVIDLDVGSQLTNSSHTISGIALNNRFYFG